MKVIERFAATVQGVSASLKMGVAEGPTGGQAKDIFQVVTQGHGPTRDEFTTALESASANPELFGQKVAMESTREDWDSPEEDEAWRHLQEER